MGKLLEAFARLRQSLKLSRGQCENLTCRKPLRDDVRPVNGFRTCSDACAHEAWLDSFV